MAHAYTPGLKVTSRITHTVRRLLPIKGEVLVEAGQVVQARDVIARTFLPGKITPVNLANLLQMPPGDVKECLLMKQGDEVKVGDVLAQTKGIFGMFKSAYRSEYEGTIETISEVTGQLILRGEPLPVQVEAYLDGTVKEVIADEGVVIEAEVSFIQGIFGIGGEAYGKLHLAATSHTQELSEDLITADMKDVVIIGGARVTHGAIQKAIEVGVAAVISGGLDDQDLKKILGYDLGVAITGTEKIGLTLIITEGFGDIAMAERTYNLLKSRVGSFASVNGATQIRAGVLRPEIVIPIGENDDIHAEESKHETGMLDEGRAVRVIRDPYFGKIGEVDTLPSEPQVLGSGSKARVVGVKLASGETVIIPRANVELIEN